jgi:hypothetical protein
MDGQVFRAFSNTLSFAAAGQSAAAGAQLPSPHRAGLFPGQVPADDRLAFADASWGMTTMPVSAASPITGVVKTGRTGVVITGPKVSVGFAVALAEEEGDVHPAARHPKARSAIRRRTCRNRFIVPSMG